jgi:hypothetical protein
VQHDALEEAAVLLQEGAARVELRLQGRHEFVDVSSTESLRGVIDAAE